jgi:hypothetical protein
MKILWWRLLAGLGAWMGLDPPFGLFVLWAHGHKVRPIARWTGDRWCMTGVKVSK